MSGTHHRPVPHRVPALLAVVVAAGLGACSTGSASESPPAESTVPTSAESTPAASTAAPAADSPAADTPTSSITLEPGVLPLTPENLHGIWIGDRNDPAGLAVLNRHSIDGSYATGGAFDNDALLYGTFEVGDDIAPYTSSGGRCHADCTWSYETSLVADGRLELVHHGSDERDPGQIGDCDIGAPPWQHRFTRLSPLVPGAADLAMGVRTPDSSVAARSPATVRGYWIVLDTGLLVRIDENEDYALGDRAELADDPKDAGSTDLGDGTLTFTGTGRADCPPATS